MGTKDLINSGGNYSAEERAAKHAQYVRQYLNANLLKENSLLRKISFSLVLIVIVLIGALVYQSNKSTMVPYVIETDGSGHAIGIATAKQTNYTPQEKEKQHFIERFIQDTREIPLDPVVAKKHWLRATTLLTQSTKTKLQEEFRKDNTTGRVGLETVQIQLRSNVAQSPDTYQVRWIEEVYTKDGSLKERYNMVGSFTIEFGKPRNEEEWRVNPLGIYIKNFSWQRELR